MIKEPYHYGDRVNTPYGLGTIVGFEKFNDDGSRASPSILAPTLSSRVIVALDNPEKWVGGI